ncbi:MAG TPA: tetratricopeptide repeat protein [Longimicrobiales bacterium]|nr:tetratricopeptide repeat protein [Longimicrobiales bacterium]
MIDTARVLRPLNEAASAIDQLDEYQSTEELGSAVQTTWRAIDRTLRNLLRADPDAPDAVRLGALSPADLPLDQLIAALRTHNRISLQLAGMIHELDHSKRRLEQSAARPSDADHARKVVDVLRAEVNAYKDQPVLTASHHAVESGMMDLPAHPVQRSVTGRGLTFLRSASARRWFAPAAIGAGALILLVVVIALLGGDSNLERGIAAFEAQQWAEAERLLKEESEDPDNATAQLYLARVYRASQQYDRAADVLRTAAVRHPEDDDIQREVGKLFLDLYQPERAVTYLRKAQELDTEDRANWIWLVRALRAAGDPTSEEVLQSAPAEVRATLTTAN